MNAITPDTAYRYLIDLIIKINGEKPHFGGITFRPNLNLLWTFSLKDDAKTSEIALLYAWKTITEALLTVCTLSEVADRRFRCTYGLALLHGGLSSGSGQSYVCARSGTVWVEAEYSATHSASPALNHGDVNLSADQDEARFHKALLIALRNCLVLYRDRVDAVEGHILKATKF